MRLLQAARLSKTVKRPDEKGEIADASTSIDKQDEEMQRWAGARGHEVVATAVDKDVSGDVPPFDRPGLGPWLSDPEKIASYDGILAAHIDRLGRSTNDFVDLLRWAERNNKTIITTALDETIDFSQGVGKLIGYMMMWLAEEELKAIKRRTSATFVWLRDNGYLTGKPPFGYVVAGKDKHKTIVPDSALIRDGRHILALAAEKYVSGWTLTRICEWLDSEGIKPAQNGRWMPSSLSQIFANPVLIGQLESKGKEVRGKDGLKLQRCDPVLTTGEWKALQDRLAVNPTRRLPVESGALVRVAFCRKCDGPMNRHVSRRTGRNGQKYESVYWRCSGTAREPSKCRNMIREDHLVETIDFELLENFGDRPLTRRRLILGNGVAERLAEVTEAMTELEDDRYSRRLYKGADGAERFAARYSALEAESELLRSQEAVAERWEQVPTGQTVASRWAGLDLAEKGAFLREIGAMAHARKFGDDGQHLAVLVTIPNSEKAVAILTAI